MTSVFQILLYVQAGFLFASLPLSVVAAYGFRGTPWGRVLAPLPVVDVAFAVGIGVTIFGVTEGPWLLLEVVSFGVGVLGTALIAVRLSRLVSGGVQT